jgi:TolB-like protein/Tfp pilus assembly protein PilF
LKEVRREMQERGIDTTIRSVSSAASEARTRLQSETTRVQSQRSTAESPAEASTRVSNAEFIVNGLKRHKTATVAGAILVLLIAGAVVFGVRSYLHAANSEVAVDSIAVIPFVNQTNDPNAEWISDGLTEAIINDLTQLPNLKVIARSSVFRYKGSGEPDPLAIGKELGVRAVLTGRMGQRGDTMLISAWLVDIRDNKQLWGEKYERKLVDMLSVQREIAREITNNLRPTLSGMEQLRADKQFTANAEAFQLYLKGRFYWNKRTPADFEKAIAFFQQAIEKDPNYALAYSGLADTYALFTTYSDEPPRQLMPKAKEAALKSLALDDNLAEGHASLGQIAAYYDYDFATVEREYRRAIELNPNYASAHQWFAEHLSATKRFDEALAEIRRALELDPLSVIVNRTYGDVLLEARRYNEAIEQYQRTLELDPNFATAHLFLGRAYEVRQMYDQAVAEYTRFAELEIGQQGSARTSDVYKKAGWTAYLQTSLDQLLQQSPQRRFDAFEIATLYARLGKKDQAIAWLEKTYEGRDFRMTKLSVAFEFDSLRDDPRFKELIRRIGLPE